MIKTDFREINSINQEIKKETNKYIDEIKNLMSYIINKNNIIKALKILLYRISGFDPQSIFYEIDNLSSGYLNLSNIEIYLSKNNIKFDKDIILFFIKQFNKQEKDKNLNLQDFLNFLNFDIDKSKINKGDLPYDKNEIERLFLNIIELELKLIVEINEIINKIKNITDFSTYEAFFKLSNGKKYIDLDCLNLFLGNNYNENEIKDLIYRLDLDNDGKISYYEFQDLFFPFQNHLHLEDINYESFNNIEENKYDIAINYEYDYNFKLYKGNYLTEPKIINNYNSDDDDEEEKDNNVNLIDNKYENNNNIEYYKINYDENLFKEIDENLIENYNMENNNNEK